MTGHVDGWHADWSVRLGTLLEQGLEAASHVHSSKWTADEEGLWVIAILHVANRALWAPRFGVDGGPGAGDYRISLCEESAMTVDALARLQEKHNGKRRRSASAEARRAAGPSTSRAV